MNPLCKLLGHKLVAREEILYQPGYVRQAYYTDEEGEPGDLVGMSHEPVEMTWTSDEVCARRGCEFAVWWPS